MSPERRDDLDEQDDYYDEAPRSIFAATWFRAVLILIVVGVVGAVAVPYVLDWMNPPAPVAKQAALPRPAPPPPSPPAVAAPVTPEPSTSTASTPSTPPTSTLAPATTSPTTPPSPPPPSAARRDPTMPSPPPARVAQAPRTEPRPTPPAAAKPAPEPKPEPRPAAKPEEAGTASKPAAPQRVAAVSATPPSAPRATTGGPWWVQVGAFKDEATAKKLAAQLREQSFTVEESTTRTAGTAAPKSAATSPAPAAKAAPSAATDQYDVYVTGTTAGELNHRLAAKGLNAQASSNGVVIKPSLPLRDAVGLSKDLAADGLKVQVRRAGSPEAPATARVAAGSRTPAAATGETLYRVRVGAFPDRPAAVTVLKDLEAKGFKPFLARGGS